jgi:hypothetical protein
MSAFIKANLADSALPYFDQSTMAARKALQRGIRQRFDQFRRSFNREGIKDFSKRS